MKIKIICSIVPLILFLSLIVFFKLGLGKDPNLLPSMLVDKPVPIFHFPSLENTQVNLSDADLKGHITLLNVWASWCEVCQIEHPILVDIAEQKGIKLYGLNYKDEQKAALSFLQKMGNPYEANIYDPRGDLAMEFGVYGTPETFIIDQQGTVRYRYVGPLTLESWEKDLLPRIKKLQEGVM